MRIKLIGLLTLVCLFLTGCGTTRARSDFRTESLTKQELYSKRYIYGGVREDVKWIGAPWLDTEMKNDAQGGGLVYMEMPLGLIDMPISMVIDTLLLPYDAWKVATYEK
jgi:uncharacterized protein YceK